PKSKEPSMSIRSLSVGLIAASCLLTAGQSLRGQVPLRLPQALPGGNVAPAAAANPGPWTRLTTLAVIHGKWLDARGLRALQRAVTPDQVLAAFPTAAAHRLAAIAMEVGFDVLLEAKNRPGHAVAIVEKNVEVIFSITTDRTFSGNRYYRPAYT